MKAQIFIEMLLNFQSYAIMELLQVGWPS